MSNLTLRDDIEVARSDPMLHANENTGLTSSTNIYIDDEDEDDEKEKINVDEDEDDEEDDDDKEMNVLNKLIEIETARGEEKSNMCDDDINMGLQRMNINDDEEEDDNTKRIHSIITSDEYISIFNYAHSIQQQTQQTTSHILSLPSHFHVYFVSLSTDKSTLIITQIQNAKSNTSIIPIQSNEFCEIDAEFKNILVCLCLCVQECVCVFCTGLLIFVWLFVFACV